MNNRIARMLRKMHSNDHEGKRTWNSLDHATRGKVRAYYMNTPMSGTLQNVLINVQQGI